MHLVAPNLMAVKRPDWHIRDERLVQELPAALLARIDAIIFPSVHQSESRRPCLTVHPVGNLTDDVSVGGRPRTVNPVPALLMTEAFHRLREEGARVGMEATFEATHHGPALPVPCFFIEAGSTETEWNRTDLHRAIADSLLGLPDTLPERPIVLGLGGGHYMPYFKDLVRRRSVALGHMVPTHHLPGVTREFAQQLVQASPGATGLVYAKTKDRTGSPFEGLMPSLAEGELPNAP